MTEQKKSMRKVIARIDFSNLTGDTEAVVRNVRTIVEDPHFRDSIAEIDPQEFFDLPNADDRADMLEEVGAKCSEHELIGVANALYALLVYAGYTATEVVDHTAYVEVEVVEEETVEEDDDNDDRRDRRRGRRGGGMGTFRFNHVTVNGYGEFAYEFFRESAALDLVAADVARRLEEGELEFDNDEDDRVAGKFRDWWREKKNKSTKYLSDDEKLKVFTPGIGVIPADFSELLLGMSNFHAVDINASVYDYATATADASSGMSASVIIQRLKVLASVITKTWKSNIRLGLRDITKENDLIYDLLTEEVVIRSFGAKYDPDDKDGSLLVMLEKGNYDSSQVLYACAVYYDDLFRALAKHLKNGTLDQYAIKGMGEIATDIVGLAAIENALPVGGQVAQGRRPFPSVDRSGGTIAVPAGKSRTGTRSWAIGIGVNISFGSTN